MPIFYTIQPGGSADHPIDTLFMYENRAGFSNAAIMGERFLSLINSCDSSRERLTRS